MDLTGIDVNYYVRVDRYAESHDSFDAPNPWLLKSSRRGSSAKRPARVGTTILTQSKPVSVYV